jgi:hypothetical protein
MSDLQASRNSFTFAFNATSQPHGTTKPLPKTTLFLLLSVISNAGNDKLDTAVAALSKYGFFKHSIIFPLLIPLD